VPVEGDPTNGNELHILDIESDDEEEVYCYECVPSDGEGHEVYVVTRAQGQRFDPNMDLPVPFATIQVMVKRDMF
jgi:hypothetical protein